MLDHPPREEEVAPRGRSVTSPHTTSSSPRAGGVRRRAAGRAALRARAGSRAPPTSTARLLRVLRMRSDSLRGERLERLRSKRGSEQHLDELARERARRASAPTARFRTTTPPNAETGSAASAFAYASSIVSATATPHGFACFTITQAGPSSSADEEPRGGEVVQVVERERLPLMLLDAREQVRARAALRVVRGASGAGSRRTELAHAVERRHERLRERSRPAGTSARSPRRRPRSARTPRAASRAARSGLESTLPGPQLREHRLVVLAGDRPRRT